MPTRREFLWTAGGAAAALTLQGLPEVSWTPEQVDAAGWEPGIEALRNSTCLLCPSRCGIRGRTVDGRLVRILGNSSHPLSQGGVCPRGIAGVQRLYHPDRLTSPVERGGPRGGGVWNPLAPEQALEQLATRLRALRAGGRPDRLAVVSGYARGTMEDVWRQFLRAFGSPHYVADDCNDATDVILSLMHGIQRPPAYDLERSGVVLSFGAPLFDAWWSPLQAYVAFGRPANGGARAARPHFIQVDTRFSRTAARAHEWAGIRPGTHGVLALGIAYVLIKEELVDAAFLARHVSGFEDATDASGAVREGYRSLVLRHYRSEEVSAITGVPVERIVSLAHTIAERRPIVAVCGADVMLAPDGLLQGVAVHSLNVLMGSINRPGGVLVGDDPPLAPLAEPVLDRVAAASLARKPAACCAPPFGTGDAARQFAENIASGRAEPPEVLFLYYANPVESSVSRDLWEQALERIPYVVSFSPFLDGTSQRADLVLPDLLPYERWQDGVGPATYAYPTWSIVQPLVTPRHTGVATGDAVLQLARALGGSVARSLPYDNMETLLQVRARGLFAAERGVLFGDEFNRTHYRQMEERGWWLREHADFDSFWAGLLQRGGWADLFYDDADPAKLARTADGRIALLPPKLVQALAAEGRGRRLYARPGEPEPQPAADFPLRLVPYRVAGIASGGVSLQPWLWEQPTVLPDQHWVPWVELHPATADALGLADRAMAWVISPRARYRARIKIFPGVAKENVNAPYGLRHPSGEPANPLQLLDGGGDPLTGLSAWFTTFVRLEPA